MKKTIIILVILFLLFFPKQEETLSIMSQSDNYNNIYELVFDDELLNFRNFKLKMGIFTSYEYNISRVYIEYPQYIKEKFSDKEYFSFNSNNFNRGLEELKQEYINCLNNRYLYSEIDKDINETRISKIQIYTEKDAINKFINKYPKVKVKQILKNFNLYIEKYIKM